MSGLFLRSPENQLSINAPLFSLCTVQELAGDAYRFVSTDEGAVLDEDNWLISEGAPVRCGNSIVVADEPIVMPNIDTMPSSLLINGIFADIANIEINGGLLDFERYDGTIASIEADTGFSLTPTGFSNPLQAFDIDPPVVTFSRSSLKQNPGTPYAPEASALDASEGELEVSYENPVDINVLGVYTVIARATDAAGNEASATQVVEVKNLVPPTVFVEADSQVEAGEPVNVTGSVELGDGESATYEWTQVSGPLIEITNANSLTMTYTAPRISGPENLSFQLVATDNLGESGMDTVTHTVRDTIPPVITRIGPDSQSIKIGDTYTDLGFTASDNIDGPITPVINNPVDPRYPSIYTVTATATDQAGNVSSLTRTVIVNNLVGPTAYAGESLNVGAGRAVELSGAGSTAGDSAIVRYAWQQISGRSVVLSNPYAQLASYTAPLIPGPEDLVFRLTLTDSRGYTDSAEVTHHVIDVEVPVIKLIAGQDTVTVGGQWVDAGATVVDNVDGTRKIYADSEPDLSIPGTVEVGYFYTDAAGNVAESVFRELTVLAPYSTSVSNSLTGTGIEVGSYRVRLYTNIYDNASLVFDEMVDISGPSYAVAGLRVAPGTTLYGFALHHRFGGFPIYGVAE